ncbi:MAG TPA: peptidoglycan-binding protein [Chthoniobacterales bacterium]|nr:peptidoglycan-binding protein [Chthoniobacterales bacterium]
MKIFTLLTFCFTIAFAPVASAAKQDEVKAPKSRSQSAPKNIQKVGPKVSAPRHVPQGPKIQRNLPPRSVSPRVHNPQGPKIQRNLPPTPVSPRIHNTQPKVRPPVTTVQPNPKIQRQDTQDQPRIRRNPTVTQVPRVNPNVQPEADRRSRQRNDQVNENWRRRNSNDNSWQNARRRHHRQHRHRDWWRSHYTRFALFGTGYYFWDQGYWYPAYGYDPAYNTYSYEEPIYGYGDLEPAQVIANVQTELQRLGYYRYAVDGLMGPATRAAISAFQRDNGLAITSAIDEPTLQTLGLA